jgi:hypothetical protein
MVMKRNADRLATDSGKARAHWIVVSTHDIEF